MSRFILGLLAISLDGGSPASDVRTSQWKTLRFATMVETFAGDVGVDSEDFSSEDWDGANDGNDFTNALEARAGDG